MVEKGFGEWVWDVIEDVEYIVENLKESYVKSFGYVLIGVVFFKFGD